MGVDTRLYISVDYRLEDIAAVLEAIGCSNIRVQHPIDGAAGLDYLILYLTGPTNTERTLHVHSHSPTPLGRATLLSLRSNYDGIELLRKVAEIMGGLLQLEDSVEQYEWYDGELTPDDGLTYHLRYAVLHDGLKATSRDTRGVIQELSKSVERWNKEVGGR